jgi:type IV pilus assembly protein PilQ
MIRRSLKLATALLLLASGPAFAGTDREGEVRAVSLVPAAGRAELVIHVAGAGEVTDQTLRDPNRIVLDVAGTHLAAGVERLVYDGITRAGVRNVRIRQFAPGVVRIVLDMDQIVPYRIERTPDAIRVSFGADAGFLAWSSGSIEPLRAALADDDVAVEVPRARPETPRSAGKSQQTRQEPRITVSWDRASIDEVVSGFQAVSGRSIIIGKGITGTVTAEIRDRPWTEAFYAILSSQGLSARELPGGIIRVDAPATLAEIDSLEPLENAVVRVNYANVGPLAASIKGVLTKRGGVMPDTATNSLIITDTRSNIQYVVDFVSQLDLRPKQISIQAKIIFVDRTDLERLGFKYDIGSRQQFFNRLIQRPDPIKGGQPYAPGVNVVNLGGNQISALGNAEANVGTPALDLIFSTALGGFSVTSFLQALEQVDLSDVQAEPSTTTSDNKRASIVVGDEIPVRVIDANAPTAAGQATRANVQYKETGIKLLVTPHVTNDGRISMDLEVERSNLQTLAAADLGFIISKQNVKNNILVGDGETAVIGGLTVTTVTKSRSGIPLLSSLPLIGSLFAVSNSSENRRDLIILITPKILTESTTGM